MGSVKDINVDIQGVSFVCRSCAIIENKDKILFQKRKGDKFWALPGGKIEILEKTKEALMRELKEELGIEDISVGEVVSVTENFFKWDGKQVHQYIFTHKVHINEDKYNSIEDEFEGAEIGKNVIFKWIKKSELKNENIKPDYIVDQILNMKNTVIFSTCEE